MKKCTIILMIIASLLIFILAIVFVPRFYELSSTESGYAVSQILSGFIGGFVTLLGVILSNSWQSESVRETIRKEHIPYFVMKTLDPQIKRCSGLPWGGDPAPANTWNFWIEHKTNKDSNKRAYSTFRLVNVGRGLAQDIELYDVSEDKRGHIHRMYDSCVPERGIGSLLLYITIDYYVDEVTDSLTREFKITFCDLVGDRYEQSLLLSVFFHDESVHTIKWISKSPRLITT